MSKIIRLAVLSDLHFSSGNQGVNATYVILDRPEVRKQNPYRDLIELIDSENLRADVVLCPGDITYQADQNALRSAWDALNKIAGGLGAAHLLTATGNHDISSRDVKDASPEVWEFLKALSPSYPYPSGSKVQWLSYWAQHYMIVEALDVRFVILNSCNCHSRGGDEWKHGRVTDFTIATLMRELGDMPRSGLNVLLCHHHPAKHPDLSQASIDYSEMTQGSKLLSELGERDEAWLVIHGHKHSPRLEYAQSGGSEAPVIFSAGSMSAVLPPNYFAGAANQFYIIEIDLDDVQDNGVVGKFEVWDWHEGQGWNRCRQSGRSGARISDGAGFGYRANLTGVARDITASIGGSPVTKWNDLVARMPLLKYLTPVDLEKVKAKLKANHEIEVLTDSESWLPQELHSVSKVS